jgi:hypothetical protein
MVYIKSKRRSRELTRAKDKNHYSKLMEVYLRNRYLENRRAISNSLRTMTVIQMMMRGLMIEAEKV